MKLPENIFPNGKFKFTKSDTRKLIDELTKVDLQIANPVKKGMFSGFLGESRRKKQQRIDTIKALTGKKCMIINTSKVPKEPEELVAFIHLAFSSYQHAEQKQVKDAWKGKLILAMNKLRSLITTNQADEVADEFLFLSDEIGGKID